MKNIVGFENYTDNVLYDLRGLFASGETESRPVKFCDVIMWMDEHEQLHRENNLPAVERKDGTKEYWIRGRKIV